MIESYLSNLFSVLAKIYVSHNWLRTRMNLLQCSIKSRTLQVSMSEHLKRRVHATDRLEPVCKHQWSNCKIDGRGTLWGARKREPIMGAVPPAGSGAVPLVRESGGKAPLKLKTILLLDTQQTGRACQFFSI